MRISEVARSEWLIWRGLIRWLLRRPDIPTGATAFTHHRAMSPVRWSLIGVLVVETAVVHLLVPPGVARIALLMLGLYGLIWLAGYLLASGPVRPHLVDGNRIVLRRGLAVDIVIPLESVDRVRAGRHHRDGTTTIQVDGRTLSLVDNGGTSLEIVLRDRLIVTLRRRVIEVDTVRAWVDDPRALVDAIAACTARVESTACGRPRITWPASRQSPPCPSPADDAGTCAPATAPAGPGSRAPAPSAPLRRSG